MAIFGWFSGNTPGDETSDDDQDWRVIGEELDGCFDDETAANEVQYDIDHGRFYSTDVEE